MSSPYSIHVGVEADSLPWLDLASALEGFVPIKLIFGKGSAQERTGEVVLEDFQERAPCTDIRRTSRLRVPQGRKSSGDDRPIDIGVQFVDDPDVPFPFRGRSLRTKVSGAPNPLSLRGTEKPLATCEGSPVWARSVEGGRSHFRSAFALPNMPAGCNLMDVFNGERFLEMLPLLHWLQEVCGGARFDGPPLRACFIFDDPNLHWPRYGFVNFREIATRAAKENYHVSFATIPLDSWFTHKGTAEVFKNNARRLSLCVHGNNHSKAELARAFTEAERISLLRQATRRIERLERNAGLQVCRVMVPPHGACSEAMLADLAKCGFEAACISHGSLRAHNEAKPWTKTLGVFPSELIQGCPVLPRWGLAGATTNAILLAAFLKQPVVLRGHHQDLKDGVEVLDKLGGFINGLGSVSWSNMTGLTRTNYQWKMEGNMCRLRPLSQKVTLKVPRQATRLIIESARKGCWEKWQVSSAEGLAQEVRAGEPVAVPATLNGVVLIETAPAPVMPVEHLSHRSTTAALFRRLFTEGRDRLRFA